MPKLFIFGSSSTFVHNFGSNCIQYILYLAGYTAFLLDTEYKKGQVSGASQCNKVINH